MTIRRLTDPERFRTTYYGARRYIDPLPSDGTWGPTGDKERLPNCTSIAKEVGSQAFFKKVGDSRVPLDALRVADYAIDAWDRLSEMPADERRHSLATAATRDLQRAADRGTTVHALIEALLRGEVPILLEQEAEPYQDVAEQVAKEFADVFTHQEVVGFHRGEQGYGGTYDAWHTDGAALADWKTRGPSSQHGCYEKEVAQLGMAQLCDYWIDVDTDGELVRQPVPTFDRMMVVSIRPDSFEVFDVDPELAVEVAREALSIHTARRIGASKARKATSTPRHSAAATPQKVGETVESQSPESSPGSSATTLPPVADPPAPSSRPSPGDAPGPAPSQHGGNSETLSPTHEGTGGNGATADEGLSDPAVLPERLAWFARRYATISERVDKRHIIRRWSEAGIEYGPKQADQMDADAFAAAVKVLDQLEADAGLPFGEPDPADKPEPRHQPTATQTQPPALRIAAGDGTLVDPESVHALRKHLDGLPESAKGNVQRWLREAQRAKRPWWQMGATDVPTRHFEAARAAISLAGQDNADDPEIVRAWISLVIGEEQCGNHPPGALLGTLSIDEARALADLTRLDNFAAALEAATA